MEKAGPSPFPSFLIGSLKGLVWESLFELLHTETCLICGCSLRRSLVRAWADFADLAIGAQIGVGPAHGGRFSDEPLSRFLCTQCLANFPFERPLPVKSLAKGLPVIYLGEFVGSCRVLVHQLKFGKVREAGWVLGWLAAKILSPYWGAMDPAQRPDFLVPLPLADERRKERGYNQCAVIGEVLSRSLSISMNERLLVRTKETQPQSTLHTIQERAANLKGAFAVSPDCLNQGSLEGVKILLLDDVCTTGASFQAGARPLQDLGAEVICLAMGRGHFVDRAHWS